MGRRAQKIRSAQRPGKRERARVKNFRGSTWTFVAGAGHIHVKYGRKKSHRVNCLIDAAREAHQLGNPLNPKILSFVKRPVYKINDAVN
jgi:hypothetical protein